MTPTTIAMIITAAFIPSGAFLFRWSPEEEPNVGQGVAVALVLELRVDVENSAVLTRMSSGPSCTSVFKTSESG